MYFYTKTFIPMKNLLKDKQYNTVARHATENIAVLQIVKKNTNNKPTFSPQILLTSVFTNAIPKASTKAYKFLDNIPHLSLTPDTNIFAGFMRKIAGTNIVFDISFKEIRQETLPHNDLENYIRANPLSVTPKSTDTLQSLSKSDFYVVSEVLKSKSFVATLQSSSKNVEQNEIIAFLQAQTGATITQVSDTVFEGILDEDWCFAFKAHKISAKIRHTDKMGYESSYNCTLQTTDIFKNTSLPTEDLEVFDDTFDI